MYLIKVVTKLIRKSLFPLVTLNVSILKKINEYVLSRYYNYCFDNMATNQNMTAILTDQFQRAYQRGVLAAGKDLKIPLRVHQAIWCAQNALNVEGDFVELGTGRGFIFSAIMEYLVLEHKKIDKKIYLFDTFLPVKPDPVSGKQIVGKSYNMANAYSDDVESVKTNFSQWSNVNVIQGELPRIAEDYLNLNPKISFLHVDLNHFKAEIETLKKMWPYLVVGSIILLDDYANKGREEQWHAHQAFFQTHGLPILTLASGQGLVIVSSK
jgi:hypothetical protein